MNPIEALPSPLLARRLSLLWRADAAPARPRDRDRRPRGARLAGARPGRSGAGVAVRWRAPAAAGAPGVARRPAAGVRDLGGRRDSGRRSYGRRARGARGIAPRAPAAAHPRRSLAGQLCRRRLVGRVRGGRRHHRRRSTRPGAISRSRRRSPAATRARSRRRSTRHTSGCRCACSSWRRSSTPGGRCACCTWTSWCCSALGRLAAFTSTARRSPPRFCSPTRCSATS